MRPQHEDMLSESLNFIKRGLEVIAKSFVCDVRPGLQNPN